VNSSLTPRPLKMNRSPRWFTPAGPAAFALVYSSCFPPSSAASTDCIFYWICNTIPLKLWNLSICLTSWPNREYPSRWPVSDSQFSYRGSIPSMRRWVFLPLLCAHIHFSSTSANYDAVCRTSPIFIWHHPLLRSKYIEFYLSHCLLLFSYRIFTIIAPMLTIYLRFCL